MSAFGIVLLVIVAVFVLPVIAYFMGKYGAAGYFRAKEREDKKNDKKYE